MTKIYMIAEEVNYEDSDGKHCWAHVPFPSLGAYHLECDAQQRCDKANARRNQKNPDGTESPYSVISVTLK
jgi:hypothetical protein